MNIKAKLSVLLLSALMTTELNAHHSFAGEFDPELPIQLQGTVTLVEFINPHSWIHISVSLEDGSSESWQIEGGTPNTLFRRGITDDSLPFGTEINVDGYRSRDGLNKVSGRDITFPDGRKVFLGGSAAQ